MVNYLLLSYEAELFLSLGYDSLTDDMMSGFEDSATYAVSAAAAGCYEHDDDGRRRGRRLIVSDDQGANYEVHFVEFSMIDKNAGGMYKLCMLCMCIL